MKVPRLHARDDRGAAAVEFALIAPLLFLLVFGIIDFAFLMGQQLEVNSAARQGGRASVVSLPTGVTSETKAENAVDNATGHLIPAGTAVTDVTGAICGTAGSIGKETHVTVTYNFAANGKSGFLVPIPFFSGAAPDEISSEAVFRCEY